MKKYILKTIILGLLLPLTFSCSDLLDETPKSFFSPENVFEDPTSAELAVNSIYTLPLELGIGYQDWMLYAEVTAIHDMRHQSTGNSLNRGTWDADNGNWNNLWDQAYSTINRANAVLEGLEGSESLSEDVKNRLIGESLFLRSLHYFNLVRAFGDVPLILDIPAFDAPGDLRVDQATVYNQIIEDLKFAVDNLPLKSETGANRASKGAAQTLLAKVYLTIGEYNLVKPLIEEVINSAQYGLLDNPADVFKAENDLGPEWIFSYGSLGLDFNTTHQFMMFTFPNNLNGKPDNISGVNNSFGGAFAVVIVYEDHIDLFDQENDKRFDAWYWNTHTLADGEEVTWRGGAYLLKKYYHFIPGITNYRFNAINIPILRYAEALLIYAEAVARDEGLVQDAMDKFNMLREKRGLTPSLLSDFASADEFVDEILRERRRELAGENHSRWDLLRTGRYLEVVTQYERSDHTERTLLFPIPQAQININSALTQNPGYGE